MRPLLCICGLHEWRRCPKDDYYCRRCGDWKARKRDVFDDLLDEFYGHYPQLDKRGGG